MDLSNTMFAPVPTMGGTISAMENSWSRLVEAAGLTDAEKRGEKIVSKLVDDLGRYMVAKSTTETITNWRGRQKVSVDGALAAQRVYRCDANWVLSGEGARRLEWPFAADLWEPVAALTQDALIPLDGVIRGYLSALPVSLQNSEQSSTRQQTERPVPATFGADPVQKLRVINLRGSSRESRKTVKVPKSRRGGGSEKPPGAGRKGPR